MSKLKILLLIGACFLQCKGREPFRPVRGSVPYVVFFSSRYRGLCVGTVVSRMAVLTAAICVTSITTGVLKDTRAINVIVGADYRHERRGIRVQVTRVLIPNLAKIESANRGYLMSKSAAVLILKRKVPDLLMEIPIRSIGIDWRSKVQFQDECLMPGWHFFYKGDQIFEPHKYLLQRNLRVQFLDVVKKELWCDTLMNNFENAMRSLGFQSYIDKGGCACVRDGMYGSPLVCQGKVVGMMMAPDAQWVNCTGFSNIITLLSNSFLKEFMDCVSAIFEEPTDALPWPKMKKALYGDDHLKEYDYVRDVYDKIVAGSDSSSSDSSESDDL